MTTATSDSSDPMVNPSDGNLEGNPPPDSSVANNAIDPIEQARAEAERDLLLGLLEENISRLREVALHAEDLKGQQAGLPSTFRVSTDELDSISEQFAKYAATADGLLRKLEDETHDLINWPGLAGARFHAEMQELVLPYFRQVIQGLHAWAKQIGQMSTNAKNVSQVIEEKVKEVKSMQDVIAFGTQHRMHDLKDAMSKLQAMTDEVQRAALEKASGTVNASSTPPLGAGNAVDSATTSDATNEKDNHHDE